MSCWLSVWGRQMPPVHRSCLTCNSFTHSFILQALTARVGAGGERGTRALLLQSSLPGMAVDRHDNTVC